PASKDLVRAIAVGLAFCLEEPPQDEIRIEQHERLPLSRARNEAEVRKETSIQEFLRHVFESWVLAQHVYWSVGRGLADARAQIRVLLRLKVILDEAQESCLTKYMHLKHARLLIPPRPRTPNSFKLARTSTSS